MRHIKNYQQGLSLVELMVALTIGVILLGAVSAIFITQNNSYKTTNTQAAIQSSENAITALVTPVIRDSGYLGCSQMVAPGAGGSGSYAQAVAYLVPGGPSPIGTMSTDVNVAGISDPHMLVGYDATGTGGTGTLNITTLNASNDTNVTDWTASLDATFSGLVEQGSDVLVVLSPIPGAIPMTIAAPVTGTSGSSFTLLNPTPPNYQSSSSVITVGQFAALSDCASSYVFQITNITSGTTVVNSAGVISSGPTIFHAASGGVLSNVTSAFSTPTNPNISYGDGSQFIQLQQTAFFVAQQPNGNQSALMMATLNSTGTWNTPQALVPGVDNMQALYGLGANGLVTKYVPASGVTDWSQVYTVRLGFLLEGQQGSGGPTGATSTTVTNTTGTSFNVLGTTVIVPADKRLRHVFEMTVYLRNAPLS